MDHTRKEWEGLIMNNDHEILPHRIKANTKEGSVLPFSRIPTNKRSRMETESLGKHTVTTVQARSTDGCYSRWVTVPGEPGLYSLKALAAVTKQKAVASEELCHTPI